MDSLPPPEILTRESPKVPLLKLKCVFVNEKVTESPKSRDSPEPFDFLNSQSEIVIFEFAPRRDIIEVFESVKHPFLKVQSESSKE